MMHRSVVMRSAPGLRKAEPCGGRRLDWREEEDGAISADGQIMGCYLHGLFDERAACVGLLSWAGLKDAERIDYIALREQEIERLADAVETNIEIAHFL